MTSWTQRESKQKLRPYFGYEIIDSVHCPTKESKNVAYLFHLDKCPYFYEIGIQMEMLSLPAPIKETALFLGKFNEEVTDCLLTERQDFVYYNNVLEDFPIV